VAGDALASARERDLARPQHRRGSRRAAGCRLRPIGWRRTRLRARSCGCSASPAGRSTASSRGALACFPSLSPIVCMYWSCASSSQFRDQLFAARAGNAHYVCKTGSKLGQMAQILVQLIESTLRGALRWQEVLEAVVYTTSKYLS
jgi:hypothetical protein